MKQFAFSDLGLSEEILKGLDSQGYSTPTEIQVKAIPSVLSGRDVIATAQTGTGKTAAFVLPLLELLSRPDAAVSKNARNGSHSGDHGNTPRTRAEFRSSRFQTAIPEALILAPTRELAVQINESIGRYGRYLQVAHAVVYGGASKTIQARELGRAPRILTATPGRLMDFIQEKRIDLSRVRFLILDEADRMLDMGFIPDVRRICAMIAPERRTMMFSATVSPEIARLGATILTDPVRLEGEAGSLRIERINQTVMFVDQPDKLELLVQLLEDRGMNRALVFTRTKHRANRVAKALSLRDIPSDAIHGDKTQSARNTALARFKNGRIQVLVATDVASRGIDVRDVSHVINFELPVEPETYVHRIGRTARAGANGNAVSLCDRAEISSLRAIERLMESRVSVDSDHAFHQEPPVPSSRGPRGNTVNRNSWKNGNGRTSGNYGSGGDRRPRSIKKGSHSSSSGRAVSDSRPRRMQ